jgi:hypothetical protein
MWNSYDLNSVSQLLLDDDRLSYLSSERQGVISGMPEVIRHHAGFGFVTGGKSTGNRLWLDELVYSDFGDTVVVAGIWYFRRATGTEMRGPVTLVCVRTPGGFRLAHLNFGNYPPGK